jgi:carboxyl-terminal processing protease
MRFAHASAIGLVSIWCHWSQPASAVARANEQPPSESTRSTNPAAIYEQAWRLARTNFFDPTMNGVDWNAARERHREAAESATTQQELSKAINALLAELETSHTGHFTPDEPIYYWLIDVMQQNPLVQRLIEKNFERGIRYEGLEAWLEKDGGSLVITGLWPGGNAESAGLLLGDEILAIDGAPPTPIASFRGRAGEPVTLSIRREVDADPQDIAVEVTWITPGRAFVDRMRDSIRIIEHDDAEIGYIQVLSYAGDTYQNILLRAIFDGGPLADADALLIDIRGGLGGASPGYVDPFLPGPVLSMNARNGWTTFRPNRWTRPVGLLIDEGSRSGKEVIAYAFREYDLGPVIGEPTAGAVVGGTVYPLADDSILYLAVADVRVDGKRLEGSGVEPTIEVPFDPKHAAGKDPQLQAALDELAGRVGKLETAR